MQIPENILINYLEKAFSAEIPLFEKRNISRFDLRSDAIFVAKFKGREYRFFVEVKRSGYPESVRSAIGPLKAMGNKNGYPLLFVPRISEEGKKLCQEGGIGYMDLYGNVHIDAGGLYVHIEKDKLLDSVRLSDFMRNEQSIFSPRASRIPKAFLLSGNKQWAQKELVEKTGLSKGLVSRVVRQMGAQGLLINKSGNWTASQKDTLLSLWVEGQMRRKERKKNYYAWSQFPEQLIDNVSKTLDAKNLKYAFTAEAGASRVAGFSTFGLVDIYVESLEKFPVEEVMAVEKETGFNLVVREAYDESVFTDSCRVNGVSVADDLQLYADLKKNPLRGEKQAAFILDSLKKVMYEEKTD